MKSVIRNASVAAAALLLGLSAAATALCDSLDSIGALR